MMMSLQAKGVYASIGINATLRKTVLLNLEMDACGACSITVNDCRVQHQNNCAGGAYAHQCRIWARHPWHALFMAVVMSICQSDIIITRICRHIASRDSHLGNSDSYLGNSFSRVALSTGILLPHMHKCEPIIRSLIDKLRFHTTFVNQVMMCQTQLSIFTCTGYLASFCLKALVFVLLPQKIFAAGQGKAFHISQWSNIHDFGDQVSQS